MAFGGTDRVETTAWRSQAQRAEPARRTAESRPSRFDDMLAKPEATPQRKTRDIRAQDTKAQDTKAQDRLAARRDDRTTEAHDTPKPRTSTDEAPRAAKSDEAKPVREKPQAQADERGDKATDAEPTPDTGKAAKATSSTDVPAKEEAAAAAAPTPTPVLIQIQANPAQPPPAAQAQAQAAETAAAAATGETAAVASAVAKVPAVPVAAETAEAGEASAPVDGKTAEAKDFLALLGDPGQGAAKADGPSAAPQTATSLQGITPSSSPAPATATHAAQATAPMPPAVPIGQVPMTIGLRSLAGSSEFQIRLDPVELGRIDVKLEIDKAKGTVATHLVVDRPDTLALLQRDAGQLEQALTQAGLDPSAGGVNLSLRGEGGGQAGGQSGGQAGGDGPQGNPWSAERSDMPAEAVPVRMLRGYGGLDIRI